MDPPRIDPLRLPRNIQVILSAMILGTVLLTAADGWRFGFTHDDLQNGHMAAFTTSYPALLGDMAKIWQVSPIYRPAAMFVLKVLYSVFGMNVTGWRLVYSGLLVLMAYTTLSAVRHLTGSFLAGAIAAIIISYHPSLRMLYYSIGAIFDLVAYDLTALFLIAYLRASTTTGRSGLWYSGASLLSFWLALEAKEIAIAGAVFIFLYEVLSRPLDRPGLWIKERPLLWIVSLLSVVFCLAQLLGHGSLTTMAAYRPEFSLSIYRNHVEEWFRMVAEAPIPWAAAGVALIAGVAALLSSWRLSSWCILSLLIGILPVAFIPQRDLSAITVPLLAAFTFAGFSVEALCSGTASVLTRHSTVSVRAAKTLAIGMGLTASALILLWQGGPEKRLIYWAMRDVDLAIGPALAALSALPPPLPEDRFVIHHDPFKEMQWADLFLFRLYYRQPELVVRRLDQVTAQELSTGRWRHLTWEDNRWKELR